MTTQAEDLLGARVTGTDGKVVGTVEQVFRDDVDGTPAWARVRSGKTGRFVPLGSAKVTPEGLQVADEQDRNYPAEQCRHSGTSYRPRAALVTFWLQTL